MNFSESLLVLLYICWFLGFVLLLLKKGFPAIWKLTTFILLAFYTLLYFPVLFKYYQLFVTGNHSNTGLNFLTVLIQYLPVFIFLLWPMTLFSCFFLQQKNAVNRVRALTLLTLFYWLFWLMGAWLDLNWEEEIRKVGKDIKIPSLPVPPVK